MDIMPMSMQIMVPKSADVSQMQHNMQQAASAQQEFETMRRKADDKLKQEQVRHKDNAEGERIKDEPERQGRQGGYFAHRNRHAGEETQEEPPRPQYAVDPNRGRNLDISL